MDCGPPGSGKNVRLVELEAEARYARDRYGLYRAQAYGARLTSPRRLHVLERASQLAERRLDRAKSEQGRSGNARISAPAGVGHEHAATVPD
jgi:hypothetical protein